LEVAGIETALRDLVARLGAKPGQVFQPVRVALAGQTVSPGIFETVALLGRDETLRRIDQALRRADSGGTAG
jgi:glutamyl-tRNA synthetase